MIKCKHGVNTSLSSCRTEGLSRLSSQKKHMELMKFISENTASFTIDGFNSQKIIPNKGMPGTGRNENLHFLYQFPTVIQ